MTASVATVAARLGLTVSAVFVPFSQSRNAKPDARPNERSLNWKVTVHRNGRDVLTTDYMAGLARCPSYRQNARWTLDYAAAIEAETETGRACPYRLTSHKRGPITPDMDNVLACLALDASAIDFARFEDWADEYGYDRDSRSAEKAYRDCLETALALRAAIGDEGLTALRDAAAEH